MEGRWSDKFSLHFQRSVKTNRENHVLLKRTCVLSLIWVHIRLLYHLRCLTPAAAKTRPVVTVSIAQITGRGSSECVECVYLLIHCRVVLSRLVRVLHHLSCNWSLVHVTDWFWNIWVIWCWDGTCCCSLNPRVILVGSICWAICRCNQLSGIWGVKAWSRKKWSFINSQVYNKNILWFYAVL